MCLTGNMLHQKRGRPAGQSRPQMELCQCLSCRDHSSTDPQTQLPISGRYLPPREVKTHRRQNRLGLHASAVLGNIAPPAMSSVPSSSRPAAMLSSAVPPSAAHIPLSSPVSQSSSSKSSNAGSTSDDQSSTSDRSSAESTHRALQSIRSSLQNLETLIDSSNHEPLVFSSPPTLTSPSSLSENPEDRYTLHPGAPGNAFVIGVDKTLRRHLEVVEGCAKSSDTHTRLLCRTILPKLNKLMNSVRDMQRREWDRQRDIVITAGCKAVETGASNVLSLYLLSLHSWLR